MPLRSLSQERVLETATAIAVVIYSVITVLLLPPVASWGAEAGQAAGIVTVLISSVGLYALLKLSVRGLLFYWARPILGRWAYESTSGNFAILYLTLDAYSIDYRVDVYPTLADVLGALDGDPAAIARVKAHATKRALTYEDGYLSVIYTIHRTSADYEPREGILHIELLQGGSTMKGYWKSDVEAEGEPRSGELTIFREETFREAYGPRIGEAPDRADG